MVTLLVVLVLVGSSCGGDHETVRSRWNLAEPVDGRQVSIVVLVGSSSCDSFRSVEVQEDDDTVHLDAMINVYAGTARDCTADMSFHRTTVTLDNDLGDRDLTGCRPVEARHEAALDNDCRQTLSRDLE